MRHWAVGRSGAILIRAMSRTLILEDYAPLARALVRALRSDGQNGVPKGGVVGDDDQFVVAGLCAEARQTEGWFDRAIIDLELPDGSGIDVAKYLLRNRRVERVVFFTACREMAALKSAMELGHIVDKSAGIALLLSVLNRDSNIPLENARAVGDGSVSSSACGSSGRSGTRRIFR